jgi:putative transposase
MSAHQANFPIRTMARVLRVSASGYYAWRNRPASARATTDGDLTRRIRTIHASSRGTYGAPRVHAELKAEGTAVGKKRVARLMRAALLVGVSRRRRVPTTTRRDPEHRPANDLVRRNFVAEGPNELWVADITFVPTVIGFLFLAVVLDAWSRRIVGWAFSTDLKTRLVLDALDMALATRKPDGVIHHSDRGSQYTSLAFGPSLHRGGRPAVDRIGRRCLRQRDVRELLRDPRMRAPRSAPLQFSRRGKDGRVPLHRRLLQPVTPSLGARLSLAHRIRTEAP